jgi:lactate dehydrogenase-like 2-hydroxyacid dehydrogenase
MKIVIFQAGPRETEAFQSLRTNHELLLTRDPLSGERGPVCRLQCCFNVYYSQLDRNVLTQIPRLKLIATRRPDTMSI